MQQDSPPKPVLFPGTPVSRSTLPRPSFDPQNRGFPEERCGPPLDDRGFPLEDALGASPKLKRAGADGRSSTDEAEADILAQHAPRHSRLPSPFASVSPAEEKKVEVTAAPQARGRFTRSWATASHLVGKSMASISPTTPAGFGSVEGRGQDELGEVSEGGDTPPRAPPPKGSHAKLDLLLQEMQRLNGRLDTIVHRLGDLEEERGGLAKEDKSRS